PGSQTVRMRIEDKDGGFTDYTTTISINNVPPTPTITGAPASSPEGTAITLGSSVADPDPPDTFTYAWSVTKNGNAYASGTAPPLPRTPDENGTYGVSLTVTDHDSGTRSTSATINVTNVAPTVAITGAPASSPEGTALALGSSVTDPGTHDTFAY